MTTRPDWFDPDLFPVESHRIDVEGCTLHYVDEGAGPVLLMLHGNPTWSFLYRRLIAGLKDRFRCIALDYPGFGLSTAAPGYEYTAQEHSAVVREFVRKLDLRDITPIVQDWAGPIGVGAATEEPDRYSSFIVGNTWAWPMEKKSAERFSNLMGGDRTGPWLSKKLNLFVGQIIPLSMRRRSLNDAEKAMYRGPFPTEESREPVMVFPREIMAARPFLSEVEGRLDKLAAKPALLLWADKDVAFGKEELERWKTVFPSHYHHMLYGAGHYWQDDAGEEAVLVIRDWWDTKR